MNPPKRVTLGPHTYRLHRDKRRVLAGSERVGQCDSDRLTITVDPDLPHTQACDTVLHETLHALLTPAKLDEDDEERLCLLLAPQLLAALRDNPRLTRWLTR